MIKFKKESRKEIKNKNNYPPTKNFSLLSTYWAIYFRILKEAEKRDKLDQAKREREAKHNQFMEEKRRKLEESKKVKQEEKMKKMQDIEMKRQQNAIYKEQVIWIILFHISPGRNLFYKIWN